MTHQLRRSVVHATDIKNEVATAKYEAATLSLAKEIEGLMINEADAVNSLESLREALGGKVDRGTVPCLDDFDSKGILLKANRTEVPTFDQVPALVQSQFDIVDSRMRNEQMTVVSRLDEVKAAFAARAEVQTDNLLELRAELEQKVQRSELPDLSLVEEKLTNVEEKLTNVEGQLSQKVDTKSFFSLSARLDHKADLKWVQDSIRGLSDILLPVARTVRGLQPGGGGGGGGGSPDGGRASV